MKCKISSISFCPVKSLSFQNIHSCNITKELGIVNDRIFAFSRGLDLEKVQLIEKDASKRKLSYFLTLKNSPVLNKYNFIYKDNILKLTKDNKEIISVSADNPNERLTISNKLMELENSLITPIQLLKNVNFPFFDTSHSNNIFNSISLININSIKDFEKKIKSGKLSNKNIMFTGAFKKISRSEAKSIAENFGGKVLGSISKKVDILVVGDKKPTRKKIDTAKQLNIKIFSEKEWYKLLNI